MRDAVQKAKVITMLCRDGETGKNCVKRLCEPIRESTKRFGENAAVRAPETVRWRANKTKRDKATATARTEIPKAKEFFAVSFFLTFFSCESNLNFLR